MPRDIVTRPPRIRAGVGRISPVAHVFVYLLLLAMLAVDYILLSQALTLLLRNDSQYGSIGLQMYMITLGISLAVVSLPHVVAIVLRRVHARVMPAGWIGVAVALSLVWAALLAAITVARIKAGMDAATSGGLTGLAGTATTPTTPVFSWTAPDTIMALLMLGVLATSGAISFVTAWLTTRPLVSATEKAHAHAARLRHHRDRLLAEAVRAEEAATQAARLDAHDAVRYAGARVTFHSRVDVVRARLATRLAQTERDPESTSQIIRELRAQRGVEAVGAGASASLDAVGSTASLDATTNGLGMPLDAPGAATAPHPVAPAGMTWPLSMPAAAAPTAPPAQAQTPAAFPTLPAAQAPTPASFPAPPAAQPPTPATSAPTMPPSTTAATPAPVPTPVPTNIPTTPPFTATPPGPFPPTGAPQ